eukprot:gene18681-6100_t
MSTFFFSFFITAQYIGDVTDISNVLFNETPTETTIGIHQ